jgi:hypothetical protein
MYIYSVNVATVSKNAGFVIENRLAIVEADYRRLANGGPPERKAWKIEPIDRIPAK